MKLIVLDAETYYDREYNLRRLDPASYILDPRFELIGIAVKEPGTAAYWVEGPDAPAFFASLDPNDIMTASHNAVFDNCIWSYRYGFVPRLMVDTLGVCRAVLSLKSNSLESVAEHLGLGKKGKEIHQAIGMHLADLKANPDFYREYIDYALNDATLCEGIFDELVRTGIFPLEEIYIQDLVLRCAVTPVLHADVSMLKRIWTLKKAQAAAAERRGIRQGRADEHRAIQGGTGRSWCHGQNQDVRDRTRDTRIRKNRPFMVELTEYQDADDDTNFKVQTLANARLAHKSTIEETRSEQFLSIASLPWANGKPMLPMPLRYGGAKTHRLSGDWKMNCQNLVRDTTKSKLRTSALRHRMDLNLSRPIFADRSPASGTAMRSGRSVGSIQKRHRRLCGLCFERVRATRDQKRATRPQIHRKNGRASDSATSAAPNDSTRWSSPRLASTASLSTVCSTSGSQSSSSAPTANFSTAYRRCGGTWIDLLRFVLLTDCPQEEQLGPVILRPRRIRLPNGLFLRYDDSVCEDLYGGKLLENICQALARVIIMQAALRLVRRGYRFCLQGHDELVFCIPDDRVEEAKEIILQEMTRPPVWMPELPLAVEVKVGDNYGNCE